MAKRTQHWLGLSTLGVLVVGGAVLFLRRAPSLDAAECNEILDRYADVRDDAEYATLLEGRRDVIVHACRRYAKPELLDCVRAAKDGDAVDRCAEHNLREQPSREAPTATACADQADWRLALHGRFELPSIARGLEDSRDDMIATCEAHWAAPYVECLAGAPSLAFAQACEAVGRTRSP